ncbi:DnaJ domain-containing protein [Hymenobacter sp. 15J16-1T3B]|uniref:J domain-containing protein n=1 Tax=Hymenobacter sp. 15J16-1T3B TaxID=2886941 RepID=UPI001D112DF7|nr:DnaJ domain-containing protein [Hymenobacter sp. 15J16-1T3B]MCC3156029.1 DnaJ domain-containing protein [Hymenobacter sp. 15J16-1T3B]
MSQTLYQVLGVEPTAPLADIKQAYKQLALRYHPDRHGGSRLYEDQFKAVAAAYQVLSDPGRRAHYDHQLRQARLRAEEARRAQQYRPQSQHVYGVPMPPPAPLRTRPPASSAERHYVRHQKSLRFTRRDWLLVIGILVGLLLFGLGTKWVMDRVAASNNYQNGLRAYTQQQWGTAHSYFSETLAFKPGHVGALRRRAEIEQLVYRNYLQASLDYTAALRLTRNRHAAAELYYRLGQCAAGQKRTRLALDHFSRAVVLDSTLSPAWLARGEVRLFEQRLFVSAASDLSAGLRLQAGQRAPSAKWLTYRGLAYFKAGDYPAALADYQQVLLLRPRSGQIYFLLGRVAQKQGRGSAACELFRRGSQLGYFPATDAQRRGPCGGERQGGS